MFGKLFSTPDHSKRMSFKVCFETLSAMGDMKIVAFTLPRGCACVWPCVHVSTQLYVRDILPVHIICIPACSNNFACTEPKTRSPIEKLLNWSVLSAEESAQSKLNNSRLLYIFLLLTGLFISLVFILLRSLNTFFYSQY